MVRESNLACPSILAMSDCVTPSGPASSTILYAWWRRSSRHLICVGRGRKGMVRLCIAYLKENNVFVVVCLSVCLLVCLSVTKIYKKWVDLSSSNSYENILR